MWTYSSSCYSVYRNRPAVNILERDSSWHHIAVTAAPDGTIKTYKDGLLMTEVIDNSTEPWQAGGALMLGGRQGCYGGCRDQTFTGFMDEVRIWNVVRSQQEIIDHMRRVDGIAGQPGLAALYSFDDPNMTENMTEAHMWTALDSSGNGNHLPLVTPPQPAPVTIRQGGRSYQTGKLSFHNNYALNEEIGGMPDRDFTVEMWVRTPEYKESASPLENELFMNMYSYATHAVRDSSGTASSGDLVEHVFVDDAILIGKQYIFDYTPEGAFVMNSTVLVSVNSNSKDMMGHVMLFPVDWKDSDWHHVTATWSFVTGKTEIFFDGLPRVPAYKWSDNHSETKFAKDGGVDPHMAAQTLRFGNGSLALGQNQDCYGGCFDSFSLDGDLADVRIWDQVLSQDQIVADMFSASLNDSNGLVARYDFQDENTKKGLPGPNGIARRMVVDSAQGSPEKALYLWSDAPRFEISTAPLADKDGQAVQLPDSFHGDHALFLSDQQVLLVSNFSNFPETQVTVEFWMRSVDSCNAGVPFSYATGDYESGDDNSFLIANYNNWDVSVMGDMGNQPDRKAGFGSTDGQWHHIAVTWESSTGIATLYLDGRKAWSTVRAQGMRMPSGGTLVVGREQDCMGGCFDSAPGAAGDVQQRYQLEYGAQDFTGEIDELRIWNKVRTESEIKQGMASDLQRAEPSSEASDRISPSEADLVAYWTFEEGSGYLVKDVTANKHDLHIQQPPHWRVVGPQQVCGNGIVEGLEQCDDGDTTAGDGCSATCQVEEGYECTGLQPSTCWRANAHTTSATTDGKNNRKSHKVALIIAGSVTAGLLVTAVAFYAASNIMSGAWDTTSLPRLPNLRPVSWSLPSLAWPCKPTEDGYTDLPMVETDLYGSAESGHSPLSEPPLVTYVPPHNPPPLQDPQNFPSG